MKGIEYWTIMGKGLRISFLQGKNGGLDCYGKGIENMIIIGKVCRI